MCGKSAYSFRKLTKVEIQIFCNPIALILISEMYCRRKVLFQKKKNNNPRIFQDIYQCWISNIFTLHVLRNTIKPLVGQDGAITVFLKSSKKLFSTNNVNKLTANFQD